MAAENLAVAIGRRKTSVARVYLRRGGGTVTVNGRPADKYFPNPTHLYMVNQPLAVTDSEGSFDMIVNVNGGGPAGQAGAVRHAVARALATHDETNHKPLRTNGFLTRDPRMVERKKYGQRGARRKFQFSKR